MNGYSISSWGIFLEPDGKDRCNVMCYSEHLEKFDDDLPTYIVWPHRFVLSIADKSVPCRVSRSLSIVR